MQDWSDSRKKNWLGFWDSDLGEETMQMIESLRDVDMQEALQKASSKISDGDAKENISKAVYRAAGVDEVVTMLRTVIMNLK